MAIGKLGARGGTGSLGALGGASIPSWVLSGASIDMDFSNGRYFGRQLTDLTVTRASSKTNLLPTSVSGFSYSTFLSNVAAITPGSGLLVEEARTNVLLNSTAPATQTTASLGTGTYTLWVNGSGSATSSAGTATITGAGAATNGTPNVFVVTVAGTVTITVSGSLNAFQCELNPSTVSSPTSLIVTTGVTATRAADLVTLSPPSFGSAYTLFAQGIPTTPSGFSLVALFTASDGTTNNRLQLERNGAQSQTRSVSGGTTTTMATATWTQNVSGKLATADAAGSQATVFNGGTPTTGAGSLPVAVNQLNVGTGPTGLNQWDGFVSRIAYFPTRLSNATLQAITT